MVPIVQLVRASDCGSECRGFESHWAPKKGSLSTSFFCIRWGENPRGSSSTKSLERSERIPLGTLKGSRKTSFFCDRWDENPRGSSSTKSLERSERIPLGTLKGSRKTSFFCDRWGESPQGSSSTKSLERSEILDSIEKAIS